MKTQMYLGDGVYGTFDGQSITLQANGIDLQATDTIVLEPDVIQALKVWIKGDYPDYNSGRTFKEIVDAKTA